MMNATTLVGTTANLLGNDTVKAAVFNVLAGGWEDDYDIPAITEDLRTEIAAVAPAGLDLAGNIIMADAGMDNDRFDASMTAWRDAIDGIDFWAIVAKHDNAK